MEKPGKYVQFGCGLSSPESWDNYDASPTLRLQRFPYSLLQLGKVGVRFPKTVKYGDIVKGLPLHSESCDAIYSSHVLEHLSFNDCITALKNVHKYLRTSGVFRFVLPDLEALIVNYTKDSTASAAEELMEKTLLGKRSRSKTIFGLLREHLGNSNHLWMWDFKAMKYRLECAGFKEIRRAEYHDSKVIQFKDIEVFERWEGSLGIECKK